jgi:hypothetical protein
MRPAIDIGLDGGIFKVRARQFSFEAEELGTKLVGPGPRTRDRRHSSVGTAEGGVMTESFDPAEDLAEMSDEGSYATIGSEVVGSVDGLVWQDASGFDVIAVHVEGADVAVPVEHGSWRRDWNIEIDVGWDAITSAPKMNELKEMGGDAAVNVIGEHYDLALNGPPPGPGTTPLPPWWPPVPDDPDEPTD